ncbi:MAG TPA: TonB-dependent receptor plug domain-containing protein, partial [Fontimonas sp.]
MRWSSGLDGELHTQPLSIVSYSAEELMALGARDQRSAFETVAAVIAPVDFQLQPTGAYRMRGFNAYVLHDGFQNFGSYGQRDTLAGIERIDFIKGPGSSLNAGALGLPPGGAIDIHARRAGDRRQLSLLAGTGRDDERRYELEADSGDLLPVVSVALSAARGDADGFFDFSELGYRKLRPSLSLHGFGGRLTLFYEDSRREQTDHPGLPTTGTLDRSRFSIPDSRSVADPDTPLSRSATRARGLDVELPLGRWLSFSGGLRRVDSTIEQATQYVSSNNPTFGSTWTRLSGTYTGNTREDQGRARLTARLDSADYGRWTTWIGYGGEQGPDHVELYQGFARSIDLVDPQYGQWREPLLPFSAADSHFRIRNFSAGLQWRYDDWINAFVAGTQTRGTVSNQQTSITHQLIRDRFGDAALETLQPLL